MSNTPTSLRHIAKVVLENFQSHARSELQFGPGFNVIVGPSDNGKSAVLRAIRWALYNEPRGTDFVRVGTLECRVTVTMSDGVSICREVLISKGGTARHRYIVTRPGADPAVYEGFGTMVPAEVVQAHAMPEVLLDKDKRVMLSYGAQLDGPFLMAETGSTRARAIGRLLGVHVVDAAIRTTQRDGRAARADLARAEQELQRLDEELLGYADLPEHEARLDAAEALLAAADEAGRRLERLEALRDELDRCEMEAVAVGATLARLTGTGAEAARELAAADLVARRLGRLLELQREQAELDARAATVQADLTKAAGQIGELSTQYGVLLAELGRCPTCLQPIDADSVRRLVAGVAAGDDTHLHREGA